LFIKVDYSINVQYLLGIELNANRYILFCINMLVLFDTEDYRST